MVKTKWLLICRQQFLQSPIKLNLLQSLYDICYKQLKIFNHAHVCDANQDHEDVHVLTGHEYAGANAICPQILFHHRIHGYDAHRRVRGNGCVP